MGRNSKIEWCDHTHNEWVGCLKVSPACDHCFAEGWAKRAGNADLWAGNLRLTTQQNRNRPLKWNAERFVECTHCGWRGVESGVFCPVCVSEVREVRARVFSASLSDWLDNRVPHAWRAGLFATIQKTPNLDWLLLSKRIGRAREVMSELGFSRFPDNVWLGATIANQEEADRDIPKLLATPARVRFLSMEPLLGPVDLTRMWLRMPSGGESLTNVLRHHPIREAWPAIDWVIVGGEDGPRPMHPDWVRSLRDQCAAAGVPFFFKQWGSWRPPVDGEFYNTALGRAGRPPAFLVARDGTVHCFRETAGDGAMAMVCVGKRRAGRELDGAVHAEFPR